MLSDGMRTTYSKQLNIPALVLLPISRVLSLLLGHVVTSANIQLGVRLGSFRKRRFKTDSVIAGGSIFA